jgi:O-antigen/teichoic acid export membrane protein
MEQYSYITIRSTVFKLLTLILIFVLVRHPDDFILYGLILSLATCGNNIFNIVHLHTLISFDTQLPLNLRQHIKPILSFGMVNIASSVYLMLDSVILGFLTNGNYQVGLYQLATKLKNFLASVISAATNAAIPRLSYYLAHHETERYRNLLGNSISVVTNIGLYIVGSLLVFSDQIIVVISSEKYIQSTPALRIISFAMLFSALNSLMGFQILTPTGQESKLATANFIGVPISILANFSLDPFFGATGAATAAALTELAVFIVQFHYSKTVLIQTVQGHNMLKILFSVVIATCCGALFRLIPISSPFISLIIGLLVYSLIWILCLSVAHEQSIKLITDTILKKLGH